MGAFQKRLREDYLEITTEIHDTCRGHGVLLCDTCNGAGSCIDCKGAVPGVCAYKECIKGRVPRRTCNASGCSAFLFTGDPRCPKCQKRRRLIQNGISPVMLRLLDEIRTAHAAYLAKSDRRS